MERELNPPEPGMGTYRVRVTAEWFVRIQAKSEEDARERASHEPVPPEEEMNNCKVEEAVLVGPTEPIEA
jgi:hypothetical protein